MSTFVGHKQQFILETMVNKAIITVVGKDTVGIIAQVCTYLAEKYPTEQAVCREIINLKAILSLPKGTEHFMSDQAGKAF